jgi:hypothetical protein
MKHQVRFDAFDGLNRIIASGFGEWGPPLLIDQALIEDFAKAISRAPAAVAAEPETMLPAMLPRLEPGMNWEIVGAAHALNLGCPEIRFLAPVKLGDAVRCKCRLATAIPFRIGVKITLALEAEIAETSEPCMTVTLAILYLPNAE